VLGLDFSYLSYFLSLLSCWSVNRAGVKLSTMEVDGGQVWLLCIWLWACFELWLWYILFGICSGNKFWKV